MQNALTDEFCNAHAGFIHPGGEIPFDSDHLAGQFTSLASVVRPRSISLTIDSDLYFCASLSDTVSYFSTAIDHQSFLDICFIHH